MRIFSPPTPAPKSSLDSIEPRVLPSVLFATQQSLGLLRLAPERSRGELPSKPIEEFLSPPNERGCIEWRGARSRCGYGNRRFRRATWLAHRVAWTEKYGDIPDGMQVLHRCDNPPCVNTDHLFLGTHQDNMRDRSQKGRHHKQKTTHCRNGHALAGANLGRDGTDRTCRACKRDSVRRYRLRLKQHNEIESQPDTFLPPAHIPEEPL